jgi:hypothetical protein
MSRWFRFYADATRNPKVLRLSDFEFRLWVRLLSIASENDGHIPPVDDLKLLLNMRLDNLLRGLNALVTAALVDAKDGVTGGYEPHNWDKFQYKSDTSNERVAKFRAKGNVTVTPPDTDTETEQKEDTSYEVSARAKKPDTFPDFWAAYPRKTSRIAAAKAYAAAIKRGVDPVAMLAAAQAYAASPTRDPQFTKHAATWLNAGCYDDQPEDDLYARQNGTPEVRRTDSQRLRDASPTNPRVLAFARMAGIIPPDDGTPCGAAGGDETSAPANPREHLRLVGDTLPGFKHN